MKKNRTFVRKNKTSKPFDGLVRQLNKETVVLINLDKFDAFKQALAEKHIEYDLGDFYNGGIIVVKK